jgi:phosphate transport system substrate-binding protein
MGLSRRFLESSPKDLAKGETMNGLKLVVTLISSVAVCSLPSIARAQTSQQQSVPPKLIAAGSGVNLGITRLLAEAFMKDHPDITIEIPASIGSKGAISAVADGAISFGLLSRSLKEEEKAPGLVARSYARVPIVVGVHPTVVDDNITSQELVDIYRGTKTRWKDGKEIIVQTREPFDSGIQALEREIPGFKQAHAESHQAKRWSVTFTDQDSNQALSTTRYAIGFSDLGMIATEHLSIKVLKLNGILPSPESVQTGQYPLSRDLSFLYREDTLTEGAKAFLDFVRSEVGVEIMRSNGYLPVNQE